MDRVVTHLACTGALVIAALSVSFAETNFSRVNGFEPRFLPPVHANYKNVKTDYAAKGDGTTDDTQAFKNAIMSGTRMIYVPAGTYLVKDQLRIRDGVTLFLLIGECRSTTVIKLADNSPGFNNSSSPKAFIHTRGNMQFGEQNFANYVYHLTIEIGRGNPGAIGLNHHTNNTGQVRDVRVRATDPVSNKGFRGIAFDDWWFGPGSGRYLEVDGFKTGIHIGSAQNHTTLEHIDIKNCDVGLNVAYFPDTVMTVSCRKLVTTNCGMAVNNGGQATIIESVLGGTGATAMSNRGSLLCRAVQTNGFTKAIISTTPVGDLAGPNIDHYSAHAADFLWQPAAGMDKTLGLPVKESPEYQYPATAAGWTVVGASGTTDVGAMLNQAITNGATDILLTGGRIASTVVLKGNVRRIMGLRVTYMTMSVPGLPVFRLEDGTPEAVTIEFIYDNYGGNYSVIYEQASKRSLVIRSGGSNTYACYRNTAAAAGGSVFLESVIGREPARNKSLFTFTNINAWIRDLNTEGNGIGILNNNSKVWVLGHKTEAYSTKMKTMNGGFTELLGGVFRQTYSLAEQQSASVNTDSIPLFIVENGNVSLHYRNSDCYGEPQRLTGYEFGQYWYKYSVWETRGTETRKQLRTKPLCGAVSLYVGYSTPPPTSAEGPAPRRVVESALNAGVGAASPAVYTIQGRRISSVPRVASTGTTLLVHNGRLWVASGRKPSTARD